MSAQDYGPHLVLHAKYMSLDIGRLLSLASSSLALLALPQTDPPDATLPRATSGVSSSSPKSANTSKSTESKWPSAPRSRICVPCASPPPCSPPLHPGLCPHLRVSGFPSLHIHIHLCPSRCRHQTLPLVLVLVLGTREMQR